MRHSEPLTPLETSTGAYLLQRRKDLEAQLRLVAANFTLYAHEILTRAGHDPEKVEEDWEVSLDGPEPRIGFTPKPEKADE